MVVGPFFMNGVTKGSLRLHGPAAAGGSSLVARIEGVLKLKVNLDGDDYVVDVECVRAPELPRGAGLRQLPAEKTVRLLQLDSFL